MPTYYIRFPEFTERKCLLNGMLNYLEMEFGAETYSVIALHVDNPDLHAFLTTQAEHIQYEAPAIIPTATMTELIVETPLEYPPGYLERGLDPNVMVYEPHEFIPGIVAETSHEEALPSIKKSKSRLEPRTCIGCGIQFTPWRKDQNYHSAACKKNQRGRKNGGQIPPELPKSFKGRKLG